MKRSNFGAFVLLLALSSCKNITEKDKAIESIFEKQVTSYREAIKYNKMVYIVNATYYDGCHSCIERVKIFCRDNQNKKNLSVIISTKLKRNIRKEYSYEERVKAHLDTNGIIISHAELFGTIPFVIYYKEGEIVKYTNINPQNIDNTIESIKAWLN